LYYQFSYPVVPYYNPPLTEPFCFQHYSWHNQAPMQGWNSIPLQRQYPNVDTQQLEASVHRFQQLIKQAELLINKLANSKQFAHDLMSAAQVSDEKKVMKLIKSTGITIKVKTAFTPTGIRIILDNAKYGGDCCDLLIALRW